MQSVKFRLIHALLWLLSRLSLSGAQRLGTRAGRLGWYCAKATRRTTEININTCFPDLSPQAREELARASLVETSKTALEIPLMWEWPVERCLSLVKEVQGQALVEDALKAGKGLLLLAPHLGNWELAGLYFSSRYQMAALYSPPNVPELEAYMSRVRGRSGSELVRPDRRGLSRLMTLLREGGVVGVLPDQSPTPAGGTFAPFFGIEVLTMKLASKIITKTGAAVLVTYAERLPGGEGFRIHIRPPDARIFDADLTTSATGLNASVEACVREAPSQYQWEYKRFRRQPPGTPHLYDPGRICR